MQAGFCNRFGLSLSCLKYSNSRRLPRRRCRLSPLGICPAVQPIMARFLRLRPVRWSTSPRATAPASAVRQRPGAGAPCSSAARVHRLAFPGGGQQTPLDPAARPSHHGETGRPTYCPDRSTSLLPWNQCRCLCSSQQGEVWSSALRSCFRIHARHTHIRSICLKGQ